MSKTKSIIFFKHAHFIVLLFKKLWNVRINYEDIKKSSFYSLKNQIFIRGKTRRKDLQRINFNSTIFPINLSSPRSLKDPNSQWGIAAPKVRGEENSCSIKVLSLTAAKSVIPFVLGVFEPPPFSNETSLPYIPFSVHLFNL